MRQTTISGDLAGGHEAAVVRGQEGRHGANLRRIGHALDRRHVGERLLALVAQRRLREVRRRRAGRQHVDADAGALQVLGPGAREVAHRRLARAVQAQGGRARGAGAGAGQDDGAAPAHERQRLLDGPDAALDVGVEDLVAVRRGDGAELEHATRARVGHDDVEGAALRLDRRVEPVEVGGIGDGALDCAGIRAELGHRLVEHVLAAAEDEDEGALFNEALGRREANTGGAASDYGRLASKSSGGGHGVFRGSNCLLELQVRVGVGGGVV